MVYWCCADAQHGDVQVGSYLFALLQCAFYSLYGPLNKPVGLGICRRACHMLETIFMGESAECCSALLCAVVRDDFLRDTVFFKDPFQVHDHC